MSDKLKTQQDHEKKIMGYYGHLLVGLIAMLLATAFFGVAKRVHAETVPLANAKQWTSLDTYRFAFVCLQPNDIFIKPDCFGADAPAFVLGVGSAFAGEPIPLPRPDPRKGGNKL